MPNTFKIGRHHRRYFFTAAIAALASLSIASNAMALDRYVCAADQILGFRWDGNGWIPANLTSQRRYLVEEIEPRTISGEQYNAVVRLENGDEVFHYCDKVDVMGDILIARISCEAGDQTFAMDYRGLRYFLAAAGGYLIEDPNQRVEPARLEIGRCSRIQ